jgi:hypothetical protein
LTRDDYLGETISEIERLREKVPQLLGDERG